MSEYIYEETPSGSDVFGRPVDAPMLTRREEIVRCRDCKHFGSRNGLGLCKRWSYFSIRSQPDDFCSRAERRDA